MPTFIKKNSLPSLKICPVCNNIMPYNSYFSAYYCSCCGNFESQTSIQYDGEENKSPTILERE